jgi:hypothetical protein
VTKVTLAILGHKVFRAFKAKLELLELQGRLEPRVQLDLKDSRAIRATRVILEIQAQLAQLARLEQLALLAHKAFKE